MPIVLNARDVGRYPSNSVYGGRPGPFGNPFIIGKDGTREEVVEKYQKFVKSRPALQTEIKKHRGKNWVCWCAPLLCHCDINLKIANS